LMEVGSLRNKDRQAACGTGWEALFWEIGLHKKGNYRK